MKLNLLASVALVLVSAVPGVFSEEHTGASVEPIAQNFAEVHSVMVGAGSSSNTSEDFDAVYEAGFAGRYDDDDDFAGEQEGRVTCRKRCPSGQRLVAPCNCVPDWRQPTCRKGCPSGERLVAPCNCIPDRRQPKCRKGCPSGERLVAPCNCIPDRREKEPTCRKRCRRGERLVAPCNCVPRRREKEPTCRKRCRRGERLVAPCNCIPDRREKEQSTEDHDENVVEEEKEAEMLQETPMLRALSRSVPLHS